MDNLKELSTKELTLLSGGIIPIVIGVGKVVKWAAIGVVGGATAYVGGEVADGVTRGIAGGDYVNCN